jgi:hypothetical protein
MMMMKTKVLPLVKTRGKIFAARARSRLADFCDFLTFREIFSQKNFFEKIFKFSRKSLDNRPQKWYNIENE